ncbi:MAG: hypothetical protein KA085_13200 [Phenylobacterium sp.]|uniref:hypothetical protein n=1 Tax=Phenylobacterium sp. TaxID=1871053 RepID=UPI001B56DFFE|nr:hypothetical protein [Phenylobacterium sp.]MBP7817080.1 hypothetical protein [Phenylobacterium sp.]
MGRPTKTSGSAFTSRELALGAELTLRNFSLLHEEGLAPKAMTSGGGRGGHRLYDSPALAHAALIGALHLAGFELLVAARLAAAFAEEAALVYGKLHSNVAVFLQSPFNPKPGYRPWTATAADDLDDDFWVHGRLLGSVVNYQPSVAVIGDMTIEIADHEYVLTGHHGAPALKIHSPVSKGGLPANPDYRIVGRGSAARIVPITDEVDNLDFSTDPVSAARYKALEVDYLAARDNAVALVRINVSLAIRSAFDRVVQDRDRAAA